MLHAYILGRQRVHGPPFKSKNDAVTSYSLFLDLERLTTFMENKLNARFLLFENFVNTERFHLRALSELRNPLAWA